MRTLVLAHDGEGFFGDCPELLGPQLLFHVEHGADVQATHRGVRVPGSGGAVLGEQLVESAGVLRKIGQFHRAVLDARDRLAVALHGHHDVQPGLAHVPDFLLKRRVHRLHHGFRETVRGHHRVQVPELLPEWFKLRSCKLHQQQRAGLALHKTLQLGLKLRDFKGEFEHRLIHQFHCVRPQFHKVLRGRHRVIEGGEVAHAQHLAVRDFLEVQFDFGGNREGAFRANQQMRQVQRRPDFGGQHVKVVASHAALHFRKAALHLVGFPLSQFQQLAHQLLLLVRKAVGGAVWPLAKAHRLAVGKEALDGKDVVHHLAVADGARPATVVGGHAADGGAAAGGNVHRIKQAVRLEQRIQLIQHDSGLHHRPLLFHIHGNKLVEVLADINDEARPHRLAALRGARPAHRHRNSGIPCHLKGHPHVRHGFRHHDPHGHDLVDRGVRAVKAA